MNRRQFLAAGLGVIGLGAVGTFEASQHPNLLHRLHLKNGPDNTIPNAHVNTSSGQFQSKYMNRSVSWRLAMPKTPAIATVFCLHGKNGNHNYAFDKLHLQDIVANAQLPLAIVAVDGGDDSYWHKRKDGTDAMSMVIDEFIPLIEQHTNTNKRALFGWSMGGYGALLTASTYPTMFKTVAALSPALWTKSSNSAPGAFDDADDFAANNVFTKRSQLASIAIHIACGSSDSFLTADKQFATGLPGCQTDFGAGFHDDAYWRHASPAAINFIMNSVSA